MMSTYDNVAGDGRMFIPGMLDQKGIVWNQPRNGLLPNGEVHSPDMYPASNGSDTQPSPLNQYGLLPGKNSATFTDYLNPPLQIIDGPQASFHGRTADEHTEPLTPEGLGQPYANPMEAGYLTENEARQLFAT
jgi:hypothetical protein